MKITHKLSTFIMLIIIYLFTVKNSVQQAQRANTTSFEIPEVRVIFDVPYEWRFFAKKERLEQSKAQYSHRYSQVLYRNSTINLSIAIATD